MLSQLFIRKTPSSNIFILINSSFSHKDCPPLDLDKLIEDVQNGLYPITAYHLLFPTQSSLTVPIRSTISDKTLTSSTSSLSSLTSATENDLITPIQTITDSSIFHLNNINDTNPSLTINNGMKSRAGTTSSTSHHERSGSIVNDSEHNRRDSVSVSIGNNHNPTIPALTNTDEKENRRIIDIQCKIKTKETGLCMVIDFLGRIIWKFHCIFFVFSYLLVSNFKIDYNVI